VERRHSSHYGKPDENNPDDEEKKLLLTHVVLEAKAGRRKKSAGDGSFRDEGLRFSALQADSQASP
jgi:hypothetical protein